MASTPSLAVDVVHRLEVLRGRIAAAGGDWREVTVVAVTKGFGPEAVAAASRAGLQDFGENYAASLVAKAELAKAELAKAEDARLGNDTDPVEPRWHFLGSVQRNKVRALAPWVHLWQGVDRVGEGHEIARHSPGAAVLVQVNVSGETAKGGCRPAEAPALVEALGDQGLEVLGLMAVGPHGPPETARPGFRLVAELRRRLGLAELSMGMSADLEVAVQEGATMVRVGEALFGPRPEPPKVRR